MNVLMNTMEYKTYLHKEVFFSQLDITLKKSILIYSLLLSSNFLMMPTSAENAKELPEMASLPSSFHTWQKSLAHDFLFIFSFSIFQARQIASRVRNYVCTNGDATIQPFMSHCGNGDEHESNLDLNSKKLFLETDHHLPLGQGWK